MRGICRTLKDLVDGRRANTNLLQMYIVLDFIKVVANICITTDGYIYRCTATDSAGALQSGQTYWGSIAAHLEQIKCAGTLRLHNTGPAIFSLRHVCMPGNIPFCSYQHTSPSNSNSTYKFDRQGFQVSSNARVTAATATVWSYSNSFNSLATFSTGIVTF